MIIYLKDSGFYHVMKVAHVNIRSLFAGFNDFVNVVQQYDFLLLFLTETWLESGGESDVVKIPDYSLVRRAREGRGGGCSCVCEVYMQVFYC